MFCNFTRRLTINLQFPLLISFYCKSLGLKINDQYWAGKKFVIITVNITLNIQPTRKNAGANNCIKVFHV